MSTLTISSMQADVVADHVITDLSPHESLAGRLQTTPTLRHVAAATADALDLSALRASASGFPLLVDGVQVPVGQDVLLLHDPIHPEVITVAAGAPHPTWTAEDGNILLIVDGGNGYAKAVFLWWGQTHIVQLTAGIGGSGDVTTATLSSESATQDETAQAQGLVGPSSAGDQLRVRYLLPGPGIGMTSLNNGKGLMIASTGLAECTHTAVRTTDVIMTQGKFTLTTAPFLTIAPLPALVYPATAAGASHTGSVTFALADIPDDTQTTFDLECSVFRPGDAVVTNQPNAFEFTVGLTLHSSGATYTGRLLLPATTLDSGKSVRLTCTCATSPTTGFALSGVRTPQVRPLLPDGVSGADVATLQLSSSGTVSLPCPVAVLGLRFVWWPVLAV